jgi:hypothetical protein
MSDKNWNLFMCIVEWFFMIVLLYFFGLLAVAVTEKLWPQ